MDKRTNQVSLLVRHAYVFSGVGFATNIPDTNDRFVNVSTTRSGAKSITEIKGFSKMYMYCGSTGSIEKLLSLVIIGGMESLKSNLTDAQVKDLYKV